jgi:Glycosyltransferase 61
MGGHAGEGYLAELLQRLGVAVIEPGQLSIRRQMEIYAGADTLVFSEGSALHGRCLLGRVGQDIHVLRRRPFRNTARFPLAARCRSLSYHQVMAGRLGTRTDLRGNRNDLDLSLYDPEVLFAVFGTMGVDLKPHWDAEAYRAAVGSDLAAWMAKVPTSADQLAENLAVLADLDLLPVPAVLPSPPSCQT